MTRKNSVCDIIMGDNVFNETYFPDWELNLRIVLGSERLLYTIERPLGPKLSSDQLLELDLCKTYSDDNATSQSIMFAAITQQFHRQNKGLDLSCTICTDLTLGRKDMSYKRCSSVLGCRRVRLLNIM